MTKPKLHHAVVELDEVEDSNLVKGSGRVEIRDGRTGLDGPSVSRLSWSGFLSRRFVSLQCVVYQQCSSIPFVWYRP